MDVEKRIKLIEEATLVMKDLVISHDERLEKFFYALDRERQEREEANKDFNFKLNALIDAQIRNETDIEKLKNASEELKEASQAQLKRIENLENK